MQEYYHCHAKQLFWSMRIIYTSSVGTSKIFDAAKKISGAGFRFSKASADTIASNLI